MDDMDEEDHELVLPFVAVTSKGGPYDDNAYAAGWEMGDLRRTLLELPPQIDSIHRTVRTANVGQVDLIAMDAGWRLVAVWGHGEDWTTVGIDRCES